LSNRASFTFTLISETFGLVFELVHDTKTKTNSILTIKGMQFLTGLFIIYFGTLRFNRFNEDEDFFSAAKLSYWKF